MWNSPKKGKLGAVSTGQDSESILSVLKGEVPKSTYGVLAALVEKHKTLDASAKLQEYEEVALQMASEAFTNVKDRIEAEATDAQTQLASVESGWSERSAKLESAQAQMAKLKCEIAEAKQDIKISAKAIESARLEVQRTKAADRNGVGNPKLVSEKIRSLEAVEKDVFQPLKQASVKGSQGKNKMKHLQKVGKRFGFHDVLLNTTMPKVALKSIDKRQTFDRLVLDQMEAEFAKKHGELENVLKDEKLVRLDREAALEAARKSLADAQHQRIAHASRLAEAEKALVLGKQAVVAARRDLKSFDKDSQKILRESAQLETRLSAFP
jgi:peptidoglycan hydrolase CwlO-like protein